MNEVTIEQVRDEVAPVVQEAAAIVIRCADDYSGAATFLKTVKAAQKKVEDWFSDPVKRAHEAWKALTAKREEALAPLRSAESSVKKLMLDYSTEQERIRMAEQRRLQAEADERARKEREALEKKAARMKSEEKAEALREQAAMVAAPVVSVARDMVPEVKGQSIRKTWKARIVDQKKAVTAILGLPDWAAFVKVNESEFNRFAARTKGAAALDGVEFYEESTLASSSK